MTTPYDGQGPQPPGTPEGAADGQPVGEPEQAAGVDNTPPGGVQLGGVEAVGGDGAKVLTERAATPAGAGPEWQVLQR